MPQFVKARPVAVIILAIVAIMTNVRCAVAGEPWLLDDQHFRVGISGVSELRPGWHRIVLTLHDKRSGADRRLLVDSLMTQANSVSVARDKLIIFGEITGIANAAAIMNLESGTQQDFLICYEPQLSSTGRYLAYKQFYPPHGSEEENSDVVVLYDLTEGAAANRLPGRSKDLVLLCYKRT